MGGRSLLQEGVPSPLVASENLSCGPFHVRNCVDHRGCDLVIHVLLLQIRQRSPTYGQEIGQGLRVTDTASASVSCRSHALYCTLTFHPGFTSPLPLFSEQLFKPGQL